MISFPFSGGTTPSRNDFLYKTAIYLYKADGINFCSGSIISTNFVITAAHCFPNITSGTIFAGVHDLQNEDPPYEWDFDRRHVIVHENFSERNFFNDIALLNVSSNPIVFSNRIQSVQIAPEMWIVDKFVGTRVRVSGW